MLLGYEALIFTCLCLCLCLPLCFKVQRSLFAYQHQHQFCNKYAFVCSRPFPHLGQNKTNFTANVFVCAWPFPHLGHCARVCKAFLWFGTLCSCVQGPFVIWDIVLVCARPFCDLGHCARVCKALASFVDVKRLFVIEGHSLSSCLCLLDHICFFKITHAKACLVALVPTMFDLYLFYSNALSLRTVLYIKCTVH